MSVEGNIKSVVSAIFKNKLIGDKIMSYLCPTIYDLIQRNQQINNETIINVDMIMYNRYNMLYGTLYGIPNIRKYLYVGTSHITVIYNDCIIFYDRLNYSNRFILRCSQDVHDRILWDSDKFIIIEFDNKTEKIDINVYYIVQNVLKKSTCLTTYLQNNYIDFTYKNNILFFTINEMYHGKIVINNYTFDTRYMIKAC